MDFITLPTGKFHRKTKKKAEKIPCRLREKILQRFSR